MIRHLVATPEGQVHLRSSGDLGGDRAVLLFHQSPSSSRMWAGVMDSLAARGIPSIAADMLDYGMSDGQASHLRLEDHAEVLMDAIGELTGASLTLVGHHTGAVMAAAAAQGTVADRVRGLMVIGYPLYGSWREKLTRLGARIGPDAFDGEGLEVADLWVKLNRSLEPDTPFETRYAIFVDRLLAGPLWFTGYAALLAADLDAILSGAAHLVPTRAVFAKDDAISRVEPAVSNILGRDSIWIEGGPWVTLEHPERVAEVVAAFHGELPGGVAQ